MDEMLAGLTATQLRGWQEYYNAEPFGEERADLRAAIISQTVARGLMKGTFKLTDFMVKFGEETTEMTGAEMKARFKLYARLHNKAVTK